MLTRSLRRFHSLVIVPVLFPFLIFMHSGAADNHPPVAVDDTFQVHGCKLLNVIANDYDPDNEAVFINAIPTMPAHGGASNNGNGNVSYCANHGYTGSDSFTYQICDAQHACATATVTLDIVNQAPIGHDDSFTFHGIGAVQNILANDTDPENDQLFCGDATHPCLVTEPQHGTLYANGTVHWAYLQRRASADRMVLSTAFAMSWELAQTRTSTLR